MFGGLQRFPMNGLLAFNLGFRAYGLVHTNPDTFETAHFFIRIGLPSTRRKFALLQTLWRLFQLVQFVNCWIIFLALNSKRLYQSSGKENESHCLMFTSLTKREIRHFHVVVVQRRQRNVLKRVIQEQSCCFSNLNLLLFPVLVAVAVA